MAAGSILDHLVKI